MWPGPSRQDSEHSAQTLDMRPPRSKLKDTWVLALTKIIYSTALLSSGQSENQAYVQHFLPSDPFTST